MAPAAPLSALTLRRYQQLAAETDRIKQEGPEGVRILLLGLFGEAGSLLSALKKQKRDESAFPHYRDALQEEIGDCLWYLSAVGRRLGIPLERLGRELVDQIIVKSPPAAEKLTLAHLESVGHVAQVIQPRDLMGDLFHLGSTAGELLRVAQQRRIDARTVRKTLREILYAIVNAAAVSGISLTEAATTNLQKNRSRWPEGTPYIPLFDEAFPAHEQLPRKFAVEFVERQQGDSAYVVQRCNGINIGDRLTDNKALDDDYRFHDVFHMSYAVYLGWSPVLRALFKLKRKSNPKIDEVQDGARAILIEEGISTLVFNRALRQGLFVSNDIDYGLLKLIQQFVEGYEVERCPLWQWEQAIKVGYAVFRDLKKHRSGIVQADLSARKLTFSALKQKNA